VADSQDSDIIGQTSDNLIGRSSASFPVAPVVPSKKHLEEANESSSP